VFKSIMAPYEGTALAREGLLRALRIATRSKAHLHIVHVEQSRAQLGADDSVVDTPETVSRSLEAIFPDLYAIAAECRAHSSIDVTASVERGPVADALRGYARRNDAGLIVMSSHGRGGVARTWHGSVADRLIRETRLPVLVVKPPSVATAASGKGDYLRILVALDGSQLAEQSVTPAVQLATAEGATITLLSVVSEREHANGSVRQSARGRAATPDVDEVERYLARIAARPMYRAVCFETKVVVAPDIPEAIIAVAASGEFDVIAIATHGRGGIARLVYGSVADRVLRVSVISTLVIHPVARQKARAAPIKLSGSIAGVPTS
jgi:nucleotide-binding universal stress UspA family protein